MKHINVLTRYFSCITFLLAVFLLNLTIAPAQSRDPDHPTPIAAAPLTGRLAAGTYYYSMPVSAGPGTMGLQITAPVGGASVSVALSGPDCCSADAYVSAGTGREETVRGGSERFTIPSAQTLLITINISVAAGDTARFTLSLATGGGSGVIVTPPPPSPSPSPSPSPRPTPGPALTPAYPSVPTTPSGGLCTDLSVADGFQINGTGLSRVISGSVRNLTRTHPYKGYPRSQWVEVLDITDEERDPRLVRLVRFFRFTHIDPGSTFSYRAVQTLREDRRIKYRVRIVFAESNASNGQQYDDDCNSANDSTTRRQGFPEEGSTITLEPVPPRP